MATTTLMPLDPALSPERVVRVLNIAANLLPDEIVAGRRARRARAVVLVALLVVVALLGGWFLYANHRVGLADDDLNGVTTEATMLQQSQTRYQDVVDVQTQTQTIAKQLTTLLGNDLPWATLLNTVRDTGTSSGVTVQGLVGSLNAAAGSPATAMLPNASGVTTIGTITITGTGPDKPSIAQYVDALGQLRTVASPYLTTASQSSGGFTFSISVDITSQARCGRFTTKCKATGGK
jgi:hypothetical protein